MGWILKRAAVLLATLIMITSCAGSDQSTPPPKTTAALAFSQSEATGIAMAPKLAQDNVADWREDGVVAGAFVSRNGWAYTIKAGSYGSDYRQRAFVTEVGVGANLPEDAVYPMYGSDYFFVDNPLNRYTLSARHVHRKPRRLDRHLHPGRLPRPGQRSQLAARWTGRGTSRRSSPCPKRVRPKRVSPKSCGRRRIRCPAPGL